MEIRLQEDIDGTFKNADELVSRAILKNKESVNDWIDSYDNVRSLTSRLLNGISAANSEVNWVEQKLNTSIQEKESEGTLEKLIQEKQDLEN